MRFGVPFGEQTGESLRGVCGKFGTQTRDAPIDVAFLRGFLLFRVRCCWCANATNFHMPCAITVEPIYIMGYTFESENSSDGWDGGSFFRAPLGSVIRYCGRATTLLSYDTSARSGQDAAAGVSRN